MSNIWGWTSRGLGSSAQGSWARASPRSRRRPASRSCCAAARRARPTPWWPASRSRSAARSRRASASRRGGDADPRRGSRPPPTSATWPSATWCIESVVEDLAVKKHLFTELDRICGEPTRSSPPTPPRCRWSSWRWRPAAPEQGLRHPLLQPGAGHGAGRGGAPDHRLGRRPSPTALAFVEACGKDAGRGEGPGRLHRERAAVPLPQQRGPPPRGRRGRQGGHRRGHEGRLRLPDGALRPLDLVGLDTSLAILDALYAEFARPQLRRRPPAAPHGRRRAGWAASRAGFYDYRK